MKWSFCMIDEIFLCICAFYEVSVVSALFKPPSQPTKILRAPYNFFCKKVNFFFYELVRITAGRRHQEVCMEFLLYNVIKIIFRLKIVYINAYKLFLGFSFWKKKSMGLFLFRTFSIGSSIKGTRVLLADFLQFLARFAQIVVTWICFTYFYGMLMFQVQPSMKLSLRRITKNLKLHTYFSNDTKNK